MLSYLEARPERKFHPGHGGTHFQKYSGLPAACLGSYFTKIPAPFPWFFWFGFFFFPPLVAIALLGFFLTIQRTCLRSSSPVHGKALWPPGRKQARLAESPRPAGLRRPVLTPRAGVPAPVPPLSARLRSSGPRELPQSSHLGLALGSGDKSNKRGHVS